MIPLVMTQDPYARAVYNPKNQDYITIKRDSRDQNAWSRYNRWFHRSVIEETARVSGFTPVLDEKDRAKRPIIEFDSGLELFNHGTVAKRSVTLYDTVTSDVPRGETNRLHCRWISTCRRNENCIC